MVIRSLKFRCVESIRRQDDFPRVAPRQHPRDNASQNLDTRDRSRAQPSTLVNQKCGGCMLRKCANPASSGTFHYLHEGKFFAIESRADSLQRRPPADSEYTGKSKSPRYFWLCSSCCRAWELQFVGVDGISLVRKEKVPRSVSVIGDSSLMTA